MAGRLQPLGSGIQSSYVAYVQARVYTLAGERRQAVERLQSMLAQPAQQSPGWIRIDRTLAELRDDTALAALIRES
jgi:hypothetical protein